MTVLVTGSAGFIGFHTVLALLKKGTTVIGVDNVNSYYDKKLKLSRNKFIFKFVKKNKIKGKYKFFKIDISNDLALKKILRIFYCSQLSKHSFCLFYLVGLLYF